MPITDRVVDVRRPLTGTLRGVEFSRDDGTLAEIVKRLGLRFESNADHVEVIRLQLGPVPWC